MLQAYETRPHTRKDSAPWAYESASYDADRDFDFPREPLVQQEPDLSAAPWRMDRVTLRHELLFGALWMIIGSVSSMDAYLTIKYQDHITTMERNPMGRALLHLDGGQPSLFIGAKFLGTILVLGFLTVLYRANRTMAQIVTAALAAFQLGLLAYLLLR